jgi:release factor glutamine methyltransferase
MTNLDKLSISLLLCQTTQILAPYSPTPRLDAEVLLAHIRGCSRAELAAQGAELLTDTQFVDFCNLVARRTNLEPVAYLVGHREFYGLDLLVDARVLAPRPETELLVERTLEQVYAGKVSAPCTIVDVGTGSGAIAIALAHQLPSCTVYATDISPAALAVAKSNVALHGLTSRIVLLHGDLFAPLPNPVDIIVSNPPYTRLEEIDEGVRRHEPNIALDGGADGIHVYRRLLADAPQWLLPGGVLLLEIGATQSAAVSALIQATFPTAQITVYQDLAGLDRVVETHIV